MMEVSKFESFCIAACFVFLVGIIGAYQIVDRLMPLPNAKVVNVCTCPGDCCKDCDKCKGKGCCEKGK